MTTRSVGLSVGFAADRLLGDPRDRLHPVAIFGRAMSGIEEQVWSDDKASGLLYTGLGAGVAGLVGWLSKAAAGEAASTALSTYTATASRSLHATALSVHAALDSGDLERARTILPALVGRDPAQLDTKEMACAVVESVAENTVDAVVAPLFWAMLAGATGVLVHRAVNTMDAMVGRRTEHYGLFGWGSARLDDAMCYLPARWNAHLVRLARPSRHKAIRREIERVMATRAAEHSPNALVAEAAFAGALSLRLGGVTVYPDRVEIRPEMGDGPAPEAGDIPRAIELSRRVGMLAVGECLLLGAAGRLRARGVAARRSRLGEGGRVRG